MRRAIACLVVVGALFATPGFAQQSRKEAEIKRLVPYSRMLREDPTLTVDQYNTAVRMLAAEQLKQERGLPTFSSPHDTPSYEVPTYTPPPIYTPPYYTPPPAYTYAPPQRQSGSTYDWRSG